MFMFGGYKDYTDILSKLFSIYCVLIFNTQQRTLSTFSLGEPKKCL